MDWELSEPRPYTLLVPSSLLSCCCRNRNWCGAEAIFLLHSDQSRCGPGGLPSFGYLESVEHIVSLVYAG